MGYCQLRYAPRCVWFYLSLADNVKHFDDNEDTIEEYLSDWYWHDTPGVDNYMREICNDTYPGVQSLV